MYRDELLDHYRKPRNEGKLDVKPLKGKNPSCGDDTQIYLKVEDSEIVDFKHQTEACAICTAAISMLSNELIGKTLDEVQELDDQFMHDLIQVQIAPMRMKCLMLGLETVKQYET